ncbi:hypothetical protein DIPPA_08596 [Diplonema papillatum]|nr:hypothetical protein DIPPA_08596 [Diplonema papillatum]
MVTQNAEGIPRVAIPSRQCGVSIGFALAGQSICCLLVTSYISLYFSAQSGVKALGQSRSACDVGVKSCFDTAGETGTLLQLAKINDGIDGFVHEINYIMSAPSFAIQAARTWMRSVTEEGLELTPADLLACPANGETSRIREALKHAYVLITQDRPGLSDYSFWFAAGGAEGKIVNYLFLSAFPEPIKTFTSGDARHVVSEADLLFTFGPIRSSLRDFDCSQPCHTPTPTLSCESRTNFSSLIGRSMKDWISSVKHGTPGWAPVETTSYRLSITAYYTESNATDEQGQPARLGTGNDTAGFGCRAGVSVDSLSRIAHETAVKQTNGSRLYVVQQNPWNRTDEILIAVSHGVPYTLSVSSVNASLWERSTLSPANSTDPLLRLHARYVHASFASFAAYAEGRASVARAKDSWHADTPSPHGCDYWVVARNYVLGDDSEGGHPLILTAVLLVPIEEALADLQKTLGVARVAIDEDLNFVGAELRSEQERTLFMLIGAVVVCIGLAYASAALIARPIQVLSQRMQNVATLQLDTGRERTAKTSIFLEVRAMQQTFAEVVKSLREVTPYLPHTLWECHPATQNVKDPRAVANAARVTATLHTSELTQPTPTPDETGLCSSFVTEFSQDTLSGTQTSLTAAADLNVQPPSVERQRSHVPDRAIPLHTAQSLHGKTTVVVLCMRLSGLQQWVAAEKTLSKVVELVSCWVEHVEDVVSRGGGTILGASLSDGQISAVWGFGGRQAGSMSLSSAVDAALSLEKTHGPLRCNSAVSTGMAVTGNLGSGKTRFPAVIGPHLSDNYKLLLVAEALRCSLVTRHMQEGLEAYNCVPVDFVYLTATRSINGRPHFPNVKPTMVYQILSKLDARLEWMYALREKHDRYRPIFEAYKQYARENYRDARRLAEEIANDESAKLHTQARRLLSLIVDSPGFGPPAYAFDDQPSITSVTTVSSGSRRNPLSPASRPRPWPPKP